jgi:hypothetical protein
MIFGSIEMARQQIWLKTITGCARACDFFGHKPVPTPSPLQNNSRNQMTNAELAARTVTPLPLPLRQTAPKIDSTQSARQTVVRSR